LRAAILRGGEGEIEKMGEKSEGAFKQNYGEQEREAETERDPLKFVRC
jgi:hypothetical protein